MGVIFFKEAYFSNIMQQTSHWVTIVLQRRAFKTLDDYTSNDIIWNDVINNDIINNSNDDINKNVNNDS